MKKLKIYPLSNDFKHKPILALTSLSSFLETICGIYIKMKQKSMHDFIETLDLACDKFSLYDDIYKKYQFIIHTLMIYK